MLSIHLRVTGVVAVLTSAVLAGLGSARSGTPADETAVRALLDAGQYDEATRRASEILNSTRDNPRADLKREARILDLLAESCWRSGKDASAHCRQYAYQAVALKEKLYGRDSPETAVSLLMLGTVLLQSGDAAAAEPHLQRALTICRSQARPEGSRTANALRELAIVANEKEQYAQALEYVQEALTLLERTSDPDELAVADALIVQAHLAWHSLGDYAKARAGWERALEIRTRLLGKEHALRAGPLNNLGLLYESQGDDPAARTCYDEAIRIRKKQGAEHPLLASPLNNLAWIQVKAGELDSAQANYERARDILVKSYTRMNAQVADVLHSLGVLHHTRGDIEQARSYFEEAMDISRTLLGDFTWRLARGLEDVAALEYQLGRQDVAREKIEQCIRIRQRAQGAEHPFVGRALALLAAIQLEQGNLPEALENALQAEAIGRNHLTWTVRTLPEREALLYSQVRTGGLGIALATLDLATYRGSGAVARVWDALIRSRGLVLDEMAARMRSVTASSDPRIIRLDSVLVVARERLAHVVVRGGEQDDPEAYRRDLDTARRFKEAAEEDLARESTSFGMQRSRRQSGLAEILERLPPRTALVAYTAYKPPAWKLPVPGATHESAAQPTWLAAPWDSDAEPRLVAFVVTADSREPVLVPLGSLSRIVPLISSWSEEVSHPPGPQQKQARRALRDYRKRGAELRRAIWDPLAPLLGDRDLVLLVPDAQLNLVSFAALPVASGRYLVETVAKVHYLAAERDLLLDAPPLVPGEGLLALGGAAFDADNQLAASTPSTSARSVPCTELDDVEFPALPGSEFEANMVVASWKQLAEQTQGTTASASEATTLLTGRAASEHAFKSMAPGKKVVHAATHGFFLGNCATPASQRGIEVRPRPRKVGAAERDPMLLSGLAFEGANDRSAKPLGADDGILMSEEIAVLDLHRIDLVVLSACHTARGEILAGEGVLGLRRAFQITGARTLVMTLWAIADQPTPEWMQEFYEGILHRGFGPAQAVHHASLETLRTRRSRGNSDHPFFWAAFVSTGAW